MRDAVAVVFAVALVIYPAKSSPAAPANDLDPQKVRAQEIAQELVTLRSDLARTFITAETDITEQTFQQVCAPVGARAKELAAKDGVVIRQTAIKNRNPKHAATASEAAVLDQFLRTPTKIDHWDEIQIDGKAYHRYMRRIDLEDACLKCHGPKASRPEFIAERYPDDKAFDFQVGDLRGGIVVLVPSD